MKEYQLLPFTFKKLEKNNTLLINQAGEYLNISNSNFKMLHTQQLAKNSPIYSVLKAKHFIADNEENLALAIDLLATKLRTKKSFISDFTALHMIVVTLRCNCQCRYCHASSVDLNRTEFDMDWNTAKNTIDMIFQTPCNNIKIEYQGGEPLCNWSIIKESILYAEFLNKIAKKSLEFIICTNLTEITKEQVLFFKKHKIQISTSLDGLKCHHDKHRKSRVLESSYDAFISNLEKIRNILGNDSCSALLTITNDNLYSLKEIIDHYIELGFNNIFLRTLNPYGNAIVNTDDLSYTIVEFIQEYINALNYIIKINLKGINFAESFATLLLSRILTPFATGFVDLQSPSGAGISGVIYNYDGEIYPADEGRMLAKMGDKYFCMGNVNTTDYKTAFNGKVIRDIVANSCVEILPICSECAYQQYCGADPIRNYLETKDIMGKRLQSEFCKKNRAILDYLFNIIIEDNPNIMDIFWSWVTRRKYEDVSLEKNQGTIV